MELDDFRVSCIQGYPYEGFVIGCGYAYVENIPSEMAILAYIIHSGFISGYQNRYGDNLKPPTNVYHRMTA